MLSLCLSFSGPVLFELGHLEFVYGLPWRAMLESSVVLVRDAPVSNSLLYL